MKTPLPNTYWVESGRLLAGEHPDGGGVDDTCARLDALLAAGVCSFVDLTQSRELASYRELLPEGIGYTNFPMPDHSLPESPQQMRDVQRALQESMQDGVVYVHCRAGIGRTGVAVGCYLREQGASPLDALHELNRLWQQNARAASWPKVPETEAQEEYVRDWRPLSLESQRRLRYRGCLQALAVGDALASAPAGATGAVHWADDAGMTQCVAESLLACGGFDGRDQLQRYRSWAQDPAGAGAAPAATLRPAVLGVLARAAWSRSMVLGTHDPAQLDPAPLARSAAAALFAGGGVGAAAALAADAARVTHQAPVLVDACRLLAGMVARALAAHSRESVLATVDEFAQEPLRDEVRALAADWRASQAGRRKPWPAALGVLDRAVRCFARSRSIADGLTRALDSPGSERDAICAVYGALAGAFYGEDAIDPGLRARVAELPRLRLLADRLLSHGIDTHGFNP